MCLKISLQSVVAIYHHHQHLCHHHPLAGNTKSGKCEEGRLLSALGRLGNRPREVKSYWPQVAQVHWDANPRCTSSILALPLSHPLLLPSSSASCPPCPVWPPPTKAPCGSCCSPLADPAHSRPRRGCCSSNNEEHFCPGVSRGDTYLPPVFCDSWPSWQCWWLCLRDSEASTPRTEAQGVCPHGPVVTTLHSSIRQQL